MNEVENHYATQPRHEPASGGTVAKVVDTARETLGEASEWARDRYGSATRLASDGYDSVSRGATDMRRRSAAQLDHGRDSVGRFVEENPIMVGVVGLAAGLLMGALLPGTRRENAYFGRYADDVRDQGLRYAQGIAEQGRQIVEENLGNLPRGRADRDTGDETSAER